MKKLTCIVCIALLLLSLAGCRKEEVSLYDRGLEVIGVMAQAIQSEVYLDLMSAAQPLRDMIEQAAQGAYDVPKTVYAISFPNTLLQSFTDISELITVPEPLQKLVNQRLTASVMTQVNAMGGAECLAASAMCTVTNTFVSSTLDSDIIYLYVFDQGNPVAVMFTAGEDNTVSATATIILYEDFPCGSAEEIQVFFGSDAVSVTDIH